MEQSKSNACAQIYSLFAEFFKEPLETFYQALVDGQVDVELKEYLEIIACPLLPELGKRCETVGGFIQYKKQNQTIFSGPLAPFYPPVESLYRVWTDDATLPVSWAKEKGHYFSDGALHIQAIHETLGLIIPEEFRYMPDHLALELELVSLFALHVKEEDKRRFLQDHLSWLKELSKDLDSLDEGRFLAYVVNFIDKFITWDLQVKVHLADIETERRAGFRPLINSFVIKGIFT